MIRLILTCTACLLAIMTTIGLTRHAGPGIAAAAAASNGHVSPPTASNPLTEIERQQAWWRDLRNTSTAPEVLDRARDAERALSDLVQLYQREEALWSYHLALRESAASAAALRAHRADLEAALAADRHTLAEAERELRALRPPSQTP